MKNHSAKNMATALTAIAIFAASIAGCGKKANPQADAGKTGWTAAEQTAAVETEPDAGKAGQTAAGMEPDAAEAQKISGTAETAGEEDRERTEDSSADAEPESLDREAVFRAFMNNEVKALNKIERLKDLPYDEYKAVFGKEYSFDEMTAITEAKMEYYYGDTVSSVAFAYVDCMNDGVKELALRVTGGKADIEDCTVYQIYRVTDDGRPELDDEFIGYYRSFASINKYGVVNCSGAGGAATFVNHYMTIDPNGKETSIYYEEETMSLAYPRLSYNDLPSDFPGREAVQDATLYASDTDRTYNKFRYNFGAEYPDYDDPDYDRKIDEYRRNQYYRFEDYKGNDAIGALGDFLVAYVNFGLHIEAKEDLDAIIKERIADLGLTEEIVYSKEEPEWTVIRPRKP
ncbi:hypothetical protein [Lachnoclostridium sp. Marseille-P6806]|uniref:hypothetical protein n=1 Tax=Lachnoclostridium sp. Marseille-P6806 TaxID=2364793 RepID=UPI00102F4CCE|nr:hypothetical protein [Lachnoclostridium sp. Marseille-P6806]